MRVVELFAGVGGFRIGLERAGHEVVFANEWDKYACDTYDKNFSDRQHTEERSDNDRMFPSSNVSDGNGGRTDTNGLPNNRGQTIDRRDLTTIPATDIPDHDIICGGFPCQSFSIAGKRKGFDETRGTLFFDIMRIARHHRTPYLFLENVKGLLNHDGGRTFEVILETLDESGYDCQWQVLNSKNFGVPQNRERIIIIGHLRGQPRPQVFPLGGTDLTDTQAVPDEQPRAQGIATRHLDRNGGLISPIASTVQVAEVPHITQLNQPKHSNDRVYGADGLSPTLNTIQGGRRQPFVQAVNTKQVGSPRFTENVATLGANDYKEPKSVQIDSRIRRLTPIECERLQGFPDSWTKYGLKPDGTTYEMSDTQRYKQMGNAVTTNVIEAVAHLLPKSTNNLGVLV